MCQGNLKNRQLQWKSSVKDTIQVLADNHKQKPRSTDQHTNENHLSCLTMNESTPSLLVSQVSIFQLKGCQVL